MSSSIIQKLNNFQTQSNTSWSINNFYCSSLADCSRKLYYDRLNIKKDTEISPQSKRRMDKGSSIHSLFQNYFEKIGILVSMEEYVNDSSLQIAGKIDCIISLENDEQCIVEIKTIDSKNNLDKLPFISHLWQIQTYLHLKQLTKGKILYVFLDKSTSKIVLPDTKYNWFSDTDLVEIDIEYNSDIINQIQVKLEKIIYSLSTKTPPEKDMDKCIFCPYKAQCATSEPTTVDLSDVFKDFLSA